MIFSKKAAVPSRSLSKTMKCKCWRDLITDISSLSTLTHIGFVDMEIDAKHGLVIVVEASAPPGGSRNKDRFLRKQFWEDGKRLQSGGLLAIVTKEANSQATVAMATVTSSELAA